MKTRIETLKQAILTAAQEAARKEEDILVLAVSKGKSIDQIKQAYALGFRDFAESYLQEAEKKIKAVQDLNLCWHFIGPIQSNKTKKIAEHFDWVHSIGRKKIFELLAYHRAPARPPLNVCIEVNLDNEPQKEGFSPEEVLSLAPYFASTAQINWRGLMAIPAPKESEDKQYQSFLRLEQLLTKLNEEKGLHLDTLSMGMSRDFRAAIRAGSTILRLGQAIFS